MLLKWPRGAAVIDISESASANLFAFRNMIRAAASERNKQPILDALKTLLSRDEPLTALEIASGPGQHVSHFAQHFANITWQPTDIDASSIASIRAYVASEALTNVKEPLTLDISTPFDDWPTAVKSRQFNVMVCINMIHISPWACTIGLFAGAGRLLKANGQLITYGPYAVNGQLTPESNVLFDQSLRSRNAEWGVRDVRDLQTLAANHGLHLAQAPLDLPANNKLLVFKRKQ